MIDIRNRSAWTITAIAVVFAGLCSGGLSGQDAESIQVRELKAALQLAQTQVNGLKAEKVRAEMQRKELLKSLSEAVRVSEEQMAASHDAQLKLQAFGVDLFTKDENALEQRLLKAVRDLDISQQELKRRSSELHSLSEAFLNYVQATTDASEGERSSAMAAIEKAGKALTDLAADETEAREDVSDSQVVSFDAEIGLVVFDAGKRTGLRVGTPIAILRNERPIYTAMIVDVRNSISGAVLQDRLADIENVAVGDGIQLLPNQPNL